MSFLSVLLSTLVSLLCGTPVTTPQENVPIPKKIVMITQIVEHPALTAVRKGVIEALKKQGYDPASSLELYYENAQGSIATAAQIAQKFAGDHPDAVVAISTPSAQTMVSAARGQFPVVFAAVTDPLAAKLVKSLDKPGVSVTGVVDRAPFEDQLALIRNILQEKKRLGVLYNAGEVNSVAALEMLKKAASDVGLELVEGNAAKSSEVGAVAQGLVGKVDAIFIPNDNTVVSSLDRVIKICEEAQIPLFAADITLVEKGVIATLGYDYEQIGYQTGEIVAIVLQGTDPSQIPVAMPKQKALYINKTAAQKIGLMIPDPLLKKADKIF
jgi:putative ABC transport system substrate-binding protein